ncbi:hypothetical protein GQX74_002149 [Glossina fuscipes]|nr:hypothetical protein GQX74_002149 [Glossina fuscipes]
MQGNINQTTTKKKKRENSALRYHMYWGRDGGEIASSTKAPVISLLLVMTHSMAFIRRNQTTNSCDVVLNIHAKHNKCIYKNLTLIGYSGCHDKLTKQQRNNNNNKKRLNSSKRFGL